MASLLNVQSNICLEIGADFKWVETTLFVGHGHWVNDKGGRAVAYNIYAVGN
jgi:hypothetical protein